MRSFAVFLFFLLSACAAGPNFIPPASPTVQTYTHKPMAQAFSTDLADAQKLQYGTIPIKPWWELFEAEPLNAMIRQALSENPGLEAAKATLAASQEAVRQSESNFFPQFNLNLSAQRQKTISGVTNLYKVGTIADFAVDVFGGTRRAVERNQALLEKKRYEFNAAYLMLTGNIATQAVTLASLRSQLGIFEEILAKDSQNVALVRLSLNAGKFSQLDLLSAENRVATTNAQILPIKQQISLAEHALAVLIGKTPGEWTPLEFDLRILKLPADLPLSVPSELVHQRPDILAAEAQLHADSAAIGVAQAQIYPSIKLSGALTSEALSSGKLFSGSGLWSLASGITAPIFHAGALHAQKREAVALYQASAASYRQTVLQAFGQVADILRALEHDAQLLKAQQQAFEAVNATLELERISYQAGKINILQLIEVERTAQQAALSVIRAQTQRFLDTIQLFIAMG